VKKDQGEKREQSPEVRGANVWGKKGYSHGMRRRHFAKKKGKRKGHWRNSFTAKKLYTKGPENPRKNKFFWEGKNHENGAVSKSYAQQRSMGEKKGR